MREKTVDAAKGKWPEILKHFGVDERYLRNKHMECPLCGGTNRFRFDDKGGEGTYYCNQCGSGKGFKLLELYTGRDFKDLAKEIDKIVGNIQAGAAQSEDMARNRQRIDGIVKTLLQVGNGPVRAYLSGRGLPCSKALAYHPTMRHYVDRAYTEHPAMVARITSETGDLVGLHITHLTHDGKKASIDPVKKMFKAVDNMSGAAVRLTGIYEHIGVAEGIETALAVMRDYKIPCWATTAAPMLEGFKPPEGVKEVTVFGDNDANYTGHKAAYTLANRLSRTHKVNVTIPDAIGDFADRKPAN